MDHKELYFANYIPPSATWCLEVTRRYAQYVIRVFQGGLYWLHLMDTYAGGWNVLLIAIVECLSVMFVYGEYMRLYLRQSWGFQK